MVAQSDSDYFSCCLTFLISYLLSATSENCLRVPQRCHQSMTVYVKKFTVVSIKTGHATLLVDELQENVEEVTVYWIVLRLQRSVAILTNLLTPFTSAIIEVTYQTQKTVFDHSYKQRDDVAENFWWNSSCFEIWSKTVFAVRYIFKIKAKTKEKMVK